jgi:hypothetical protein
MKNKDGKLLLYSTVFGVFVVGIILYMNDCFEGKNLIFNSLSQGEVLAGIFIAFPTLVTWNQSIEQSKENKKNTVSDNVRDTVKYYDKQLTELVADISKAKELPLYKAAKIEYIIDTYNKLLKEWNEISTLDISLDFVQVLSTICSIKYPKGIENPGNELAENWKYNLNTALKPVMREIISLKKEEMFTSKEVKYFSYVEFGATGYEIEKVKFKDKSFIECTFSADFIDSNSFEECEFINCSISDGQLSEKNEKELLNNTIIGTFRDSNEDDFANVNNEQFHSTSVSEYGTVFDSREGIIADNYILGNKFFEIESKPKPRKEIYQDIINGLVSYGIGVDDKINNKKISISKNYITETNKSEFIDGSLFFGWNSLFSEKIKKSNNFKYYIFCIKNENVYNTIVFEKDNFSKFLEKKNVDKTGKYNFYFNGFKDNEE